MITTIGIDIGSYSVKCSILKEINELFHIKSKNKYLVPKQTEDFDYYKWLKSIIKSFIKENNIKIANLCFVVTNETSNTLTRFFSMPKLKKGELAQSMVYEIKEKTLIEDMDTVFYKWSIVEEEQDEENYKILTAIMLKNIVNDLKQLNSLTWIVKTIEPQIVSFGRITEGNVGIVDFGHEGTRLLIYKSGNPYYFKDVNIGGKHITQRIIDSYEDINYIENEEEKLEAAERLKHEKACILKGYEEIEDDPVSTELSSLIGDMAQNIADEIKQVFRMFQMRDDFNFDKIYYTGEGAKLRYLINFLERELDFNIEPLNLVSSNIELQANDSEEDESDYPYALSCASALSKEYVYFDDINFVNTKSYKIDPKNLFIGLLTFTLLFNLGMINIHNIYDKRTEEVDGQLMEQCSKINDLQQEIDNIENLKNKCEDIEQAMQFIYDQKKWFSGTLFELSSLTTKGTAIETIAIKEGQLIINGYAKDYSQIGFFAIALERLGEVTIVEVNDANDISIGKTKLTKEFTIEIISSDSPDNNKPDENSGSENEHGSPKSKTYPQEG